MNFIKTTTLTEEQKNDIKDLEQACQKADSINGRIEISNTLNFNKEINCLYMLYDGKVLISLLSMFIPTVHEAEISAFTLPSYRQKGYFSLLLSEAKKELNQFSVNSILFLHEPIAKDAKPILDKFNANYEFSEYLLVYDESQHNVNSVCNDDCQLTLTEYSMENIEEIVELYIEIFGENYETTYSRVKKSIDSNDITTYCSYLNNELVGVGNVNFEAEDIYIAGFGISPKHQGIGFGKQMLQLIINKLHEMNYKNITLEVDSTNNTAYNLYRKYGFEIKAQFDYYRINI